MTSKELFEKMCENMTKHLKNELNDITSDLPIDNEQLTNDEKSEMRRLIDDIKRVVKAKSIGELADIANDEAWNVYSWTEFITDSICDDSGSNEYFRIIGEIPDHWLT